MIKKEILNLSYKPLRGYQPGILGIGAAVMPPIQNLEDAVSAAEHFLFRYYSYRTLKTVRKENADWHLEFDVGILSTEILSMTIEAATGAVTSYRVDEKK